MSQQELLVMSQKERDRLKVLHEVKQRQITQREAGGQMGVTSRWVRKLLGRMRQQGDRAVIHGLRGRHSNRKIAEAEREQVVKLMREEYRDIGPTVATEHSPMEAKPGTMPEDYGIGFLDQQPMSPPGPDLP